MTTEHRRGALEQLPNVPARCLLCGGVGNMMRFVRNAAALAAGLTSLLLRELPGRRSQRPSGTEAGRGSRRTIRWAAATLALGLGLNGIGRCLCAPQPAKACEPQGCC